jgi:hypothetical protein
VKGILETPSWIAFARENETVFHTYTVSAPDPFVALYCSFLQEPDAEGAEDSEPRSLRGGRGRRSWTAALRRRKLKCLTKPGSACI